MSGAGRMRLGWVVFSLCAALTLPSPPALAGQTATRQSSSGLPAGPERALVEQYCGQCHTTERIAKAGGTRAGWTDRVKRMIRFGSTLPQDKVAAVGAYLARAYPPRPASAETNLPAPTGNHRRHEGVGPRKSQTETAGA